MSTKLKVKYYDLGASTLAHLLALPAPVFPAALDGPIPQLTAIDNYIRQYGCQTVVLESAYIDRDYMDDYGVFYSRNLYPYPNFCKRLHFFSIPPRKVRSRLKELAEAGSCLGEHHYRQNCRQFSQDFFLGFCVVKPLHGSPIGRTVLKAPVALPNSNFGSTRLYRTHLMGVELSVRGLAFQQQDVGVSACATTALWSSLQNSREFEDVGHASPALITSLSSKHALPFGRAMPSEGLNIDQMCHGIQALGLSPNVLRVDSSSQVAPSCIYAATKDGFAPILVMEDTMANRYHAVTVAGLGVSANEDGSTERPLVRDEADALKTIFVHDDRIGPYREVGLERNFVKYDLPREEIWKLTHVIIPMHPKIRLSFASLWRVAVRLVGEFNTEKDRLVKEGILSEEAYDATTSFSISIQRAYKYVEGLILERKWAAGAQELSSEILLARYLGIVRIQAPNLAQIEVLVDTTSTERNIHWLAGIIYPQTSEGEQVGKYLAERLRCPTIKQSQKP